MQRVRHARPIFTIGHSTRTTDALIDVLEAHGIAVVVDVRTIRRSRHNPQFAADALGPALSRAGIRYEALPGLGGLRGKARLEDAAANAAWQNASFRNYADYASTAPFRAALAELVRIAARAPTAIMCAEAVWWRCHRRIIADYLLKRGRIVIHLMAAGRSEPAKITPAAEARDGKLVYPAQA